MKKQIIFGVLGIVFLLLITPVIPASQYTQIKKTMEQRINEEQDYIISSLNKMESFLDSYASDKTVITIKNKIDTIKDTIEISQLSSENGFIVNLLLSLLFAIIGTIFGIIFGPLLALIILVLVSPALFLAKLISSIINGFNPQSI